MKRLLLVDFDGVIADTFELSVEGIASSWVDFSENAMNLFRPDRLLRFRGKSYLLVLPHEPNSPLFKMKNCDYQLFCPPIHQLWADNLNRRRLAIFFKNVFQKDLSRLQDKDAINLISNVLRQ